MSPDEYLAEIRAHRAIWEKKAALREVYEDIFRRVREQLVAVGPTLEIGAGAGSSRPYLPDSWSADVFCTPWTDLVLDGHALPFASGTLGNIVLVDTFHHLHRPLVFLAEAERTLKPGGRLVLCEPYLSVVSYPFYRWVHREGADRRWDLESDAQPGTFANQAAESIAFGNGLTRVSAAAPRLRLIRREPFSPVSYLLSGGFQRWQLLSASWLPTLQRMEARLPRALMGLSAWRVLTVLEKSGAIGR